MSLKDNGQLVAISILYAENKVLIFREVREDYSPDGDAWSRE